MSVYSWKSGSPPSSLLTHGGRLLLLFTVKQQLTVILEGYILINTWPLSFYFLHISFPTTASRRIPPLSYPSQFFFFPLLLPTERLLSDWNVSSPVRQTCKSRSMKRRCEELVGKFRFHLTSSVAAYVKL